MLTEIEMDGRISSVKEWMSFISRFRPSARATREDEGACDQLRFRGRLADLPSALEIWRPLHLPLAFDLGTHAFGVRAIDVGLEFGGFAQSRLGSLRPSWILFQRQSFGSPASMGFFGGKKKEATKVEEEELPPPPPQPSKPALESPAVAAPPNADVNTVLKAETSVFEFGSAAGSDEGVTLAGYCPVSDEMEPCRWEILPSGGSDAPKFRIIF